MVWLALVQMVKPGAPCLMESFASTMSMRSGAPTFGTSEAAQMALASGQLARRLGVPLHTAGALSASKLPDAQSQQEAALGLTMALMAGANVINHATEWLEGGLVTGYEKTVIDADLVQQDDGVLRRHGHVRKRPGPRPWTPSAKWGQGRTL